MCSAAELCHRKDCCFLSEKSNSPEKPETKPKPRTLDHSNLNCYTRPFQEMDYITVKSNETKFPTFLPLGTMNTYERQS